jgi:hypothetical protein
VLVQARRALSRRHLARGREREDRPMNRLPLGRGRLSATGVVGLPGRQARPAGSTVPMRDQAFGQRLASHSNRNSLFYKTAANRPAGAGACCPCSSGRVGRPVSAFPVGPSSAGWNDKQNDTWHGCALAPGPGKGATLRSPVYRSPTGQGGDCVGRCASPCCIRRAGALARQRLLHPMHPHRLRQRTLGRTPDRSSRALRPAAISGRVGRVTVHPSAQRPGCRAAA